jgi:hypothetical protein
VVAGEDDRCSRDSVAIDADVVCFRATVEQDPGLVKRCRADGIAGAACRLP